MDFSTPLAAIQGRLDVLASLCEESPQLELLTRWQHPIDRYNLTYEDYCHLAEQLRTECKRAYKEQRNHE